VRLTHEQCLLARCSRSPLVRRSEVVFATAENAGKCLASLNQSLGEQGFPAPLLLQGASAAQAAQTCNALYALLLQRQKDLDARSKSNDVQRRLMADLQRAESSAARARDEAEAARDDAAAAVRREKAAALEHAGLLQRLSCERDGAVRDRNALQHKLSQALNDARRREKERDAMAEKLAKLLGDGGRGGAAARGRGITLSGPARDAEPAPADAGAEVNRALVGGLRTRLAAAGAEGSEMRVALIALRDDVRALRIAVGAPAPPDGTDEHAAFDEEAAAASDDEAFAAAACDAGSARHDAAALPFALGGASLVARVRRDLRALRSWCGPLRRHHSGVASLH